MVWQGSADDRRPYADQVAFRRAFERRRAAPPVFAQGRATARPRALGFGLLREGIRGGGGNGKLLLAFLALHSPGISTALSLRDLRQRAKRARLAFCIRRAASFFMRFIIHPEHPTFLSGSPRIGFKPLVQAHSALDNSAICWRQPYVLRSSSLRQFAGT